jgi:acetylglutamate kinase
MNRLAISFFSTLPILWLDWLLSVFARLQLYILTAKGNILSQTRITKRRKKQKKNKHKKRRHSISEPGIGLTDTPAGMGSMGIGAGGMGMQSYPIETPLNRIRGGGSGTGTPLGQNGLHRRLFVDRRASEANAGLPANLGMPITPPPLDLSANNSNNDPPSESILFEANEQHRKELEGFLRSVKDIKDVQNWLKNFSKDAGRKIAIVKISRRILDTDYGVQQAGAALAYMFKFGLYPIAVHGGFNELTRDTCSEVLERRRAYSANLKQAIRRAGVGATILPPDVCSVEPHIDRVASMSDLQAGGGYVSTTEDLKGGLSMRVNSVDPTLFTEYLERGKIPIWDGVALTDNNVEVPLNGDVTTVELARLLQPYRIIFACNDGGILDKDHKAIPVVYMDKDYNDLMDADWVSDRRKIQLLQLKRIVEVVPPSTSVVVTSMENATLQLLYPRIYSETLVKRAQDVVVHVIEDFDEVNQEMLRALIEDSFGRPLTPDYFDFLRKEVYRLYIITGMDGEYNGCAVVTNGNCNGFHYLCKFCVRKAAQGLGLGDLLWRCLQRDIEKLYWRSRNNNPLNSWYSARCQGSFRTNEHFTVFWYGDDRFEDGLSLIDEAIKRPITVLPLNPAVDA